jgi:hypothetical protein
MKSQSKYVSVLILALGSIAAFGHNPLVHQAMTLNASESLLESTSASNYKGFLDTISSDIIPEKPTDSMAYGSRMEDNKLKDVGGWRQYCHFYDPVYSDYGRGLSIEVIPSVRWIVGTNSFKWASISNCSAWPFDGAGFGAYYLLGNKGAKNTYSWQNARYLEWVGLTATNKADRSAALSSMFRDLGQVMHLLQDTTSPQHVRNEQHVPGTPWSSAIEHYGENHVKELNYQHGFLDWRNAGFSKLEDFWDRHLYAPGNANVLQAAENGGAQLGLAEWCNGNFLGDRSLYAEYFTKEEIRYYPFPSLLYTVQGHGQTSHLLDNLDTVTLETLKQGKSVYIEKNGAGIHVQHHSMLKYVGVRHPTRMAAPEMRAVLTTDDDNVLQEYHEKLIPKAVEYSAGILDYFFRGTINVGVIGYDTNSMQYTNLIVNTSGQDFGRGSYSAYYDDTYGVRSWLATTNRTTILPDGESLKMTMPKPPSRPDKFILVYQGTVGVDPGGNALDPVDTNICIAAKSFTVTNQQTKTYSYWHPTNEVGTAITNTLESDDFDFTPMAGNCEVKVNYAKFDDTGTIGGLTCHQSDFPSCTLPDEITNAIVPMDQVMVIGNRLSVEVTATDDPACGENIGWWEITITWRAWPPPE